MELIIFESKAYRELVHKIEKIADFVFQKESIPGTELPEVWLDSRTIAGAQCQHTHLATVTKGEFNQLHDASG